MIWRWPLIGDGHARVEAAEARAEWLLKEHAERLREVDALRARLLHFIHENGQACERMIAAEEEVARLQRIFTNGNDREEHVEP